MLEITSKGPFSAGFSVTKDQELVAEFRAAGFRRKSILTIKGVTFDIFRKKGFSGAIILEYEGVVLARAKTVNMYNPTMEIDYADRRFSLAFEGLSLRTVWLRAGSEVVGSLTSKGVLSMEKQANLPEDLPLPVAVYIIWLANVHRSQFLGIVSSCLVGLVPIFREIFDFFNSQ